jgi:DNA/RNA endonuclease YhcR with UshA esterase domain
MKRSTQILRSIILMMFTAVMFTSCVKKEYDDLSTANVDPAITVTHSIKQLQAYATGAVGVLITEDIIIAGIVIADDASGNTYKQIILQQDSSGIAVSVDVTNFNTDYPIGRRVFVKCKGLYIANSGGNFELGTSGTDPVGRIPANLLNQYLVKGMWGLSVTPKVYDLAIAEDSPLDIPTNTLVRFENVEFAPGSYGKTYAPSSGSNLILNNCTPNPAQLIVYTSNFSTFALAQSPVGNGSIQGVYILYNNDAELIMRDLYDVDMPNVRCDGTFGTTTLMPIDSVRMLLGSNVPGGKRIKGIVTSDYSTGMLTSSNLYLQDATGGIYIHFDDPHTFAVGTELEVIISGFPVSTYQGVLQLATVGLGYALPLSINNPVAPRIATVADLIANYNTWEGQLVKINAATISGSSTTYGFGVNFINDGTGSIQLYTSNFASFAGDTYPTDTVSITGILTQFNGTKEIIIRNTLDVQ